MSASGAAKGLGGTIRVLWGQHPCSLSNGPLPLHLILVTDDDSCCDPGNFTNRFLLSFLFITSRSRVSHPGGILWSLGADNKRHADELIDVRERFDQVK